MPSNRIEINGSMVYEVPDSWMSVLLEYLEMVKAKTELAEEQQEQGSKSALIHRYYPRTLPGQ